MAISSWRLLAVAHGSSDGRAAVFEAWQLDSAFKTCADCSVFDTVRAVVLPPAQRVPGLLRISRQGGQAHVFVHGEPQEDVGLLVAVAQSLARHAFRHPACHIGAAQQHLASGGGRSPESRLVSVDLPAPLGRITVWILPRHRSTETPLTAARPPKRLGTFCADNRTSAMVRSVLCLGCTPLRKQAQQPAPRGHHHQRNEAAAVSTRARRLLNPPMTYRAPAAWRCCTIEA